MFGFTSCTPFLPSVSWCQGMCVLPGSTWIAAVGFNRLFGWGRFSSPVTHTFKIGSEACWQRREPHLHGQMAPFNLRVDGLAAGRGWGPGEGLAAPARQSLRWKYLIGRGISKPLGTGSCLHSAFFLSWLRGMHSLYENDAACTNQRFLKT